MWRFVSPHPHIPHCDLDNVGDTNVSAKFYLKSKHWFSVDKDHHVYFLSLPSLSLRLRPWPQLSQDIASLFIEASHYAQHGILSSCQPNVHAQIRSTSRPYCDAYSPCTRSCISSQLTKERVLHQHWLTWCVWHLCSLFTSSIWSVTEIVIKHALLSFTDMSCYQKWELN